MNNASPEPEFSTLTAGGALLVRLKAVGVDYIFCNSGTDFPPIIEGLAEAAAKDVPLPKALIIPHESAAMGMAHGYYLATGRSQAVIAHTNVGLATAGPGLGNRVSDLHRSLFLRDGRQRADRCRERDGHAEIAQGSPAGHSRH